MKIDMYINDNKFRQDGYTNGKNNYERYFLPWAEV